MQTWTQLYSSLYSGCNEIKAFFLEGAKSVSGIHINSFWLLCVGCVLPNTYSKLLHRPLSDETHIYFFRTYSTAWKLGKLQHSRNRRKNFRAFHIYRTLVLKSEGYVLCDVPWADSSQSAARYGIYSNDRSFLCEARWRSKVLIHFHNGFKRCRNSIDGRRSPR